LTAIIAVPVAALLKELTKKEGKTAEQIEVEAELRIRLAALNVKEIDEARLEELFEAAGLEVALRGVQRKIMSDQRAPVIPIVARDD
jgi:hypothetical protein